MIVATRDTHVIPISDHSRIGDARRTIGELAKSLGFDETRRGKIEIVASELATNLHNHAQGGYLLVRSHGLADGIEILAVDRGPGISNLAECMRDGFSTAGTAGNGIGAVKRQSQVFDIFSQPGVGTVVLAQLFRAAHPGPSRFTVGAISVALAGEPICGDSWTASVSPRGARVAVADGLGHGPDAAQASLNAMRSVEMSPGQPGTMVVANAHRSIASTRGAAMSLCDIDTEAGLARFVGVGNVAGAIVRGGQILSMVSHNGTVGHQLLKTQEFTYPWTKDSILIMHSDGLTSRWNLDHGPGLAMRHPSVIAAVLHRDFVRGRDDVCVVVMREGA